jgi:release factor glutamine methyltransferase
VEAVPLLAVIDCGQELVELVVDHCRRSFESSQALKVLEVGCGSGAVSIALLRSLDRATATCIDVDPAAVALTQENALRFKVQDRLRVRKSWCARTPPGP